MTLLATVCTGESFELAQMFGDDIAFRSGMYHVGPSQLAQMFYVLGRAGTDRSAATRVRATSEIILRGGKTVEARFLAHCALTKEIPPGHDAWVVGDEACVLLDWGGKVREDAQPGDETIGGAR